MPFWRRGIGARAGVASERGALSVEADGHVWIAVREQVLLGNPFAAENKYRHRVPYARQVLGQGRPVHLHISTQETCLGGSFP